MDKKTILTIVGGFVGMTAAIILAVFLMLKAGVGMGGATKAPTAASTPSVPAIVSEPVVSEPAVEEASKPAADKPKLVLGKWELKPGEDLSIVEGLSDDEAGRRGNLQEELMKTEGVNLIKRMYKEADASEDPDALLVKYAKDDLKPAVERVATLQCNSFKSGYLIYFTKNDSYSPSSEKRSIKYNPGRGTVVARFGNRTEIHYGIDCSKGVGKCKLTNIEDSQGNDFKTSIADNC